MKFGSRLIVGLAGILLTGGFFYYWVVNQVLPSGNYLEFIIMSVVIGLIFGLLVFIISDKRGFLIGFAIGSGMTLLMSMFTLPSPFIQFFAALLLFALIVIPMVKSFLTDAAKRSSHSFFISWKYKNLKSNEQEKQNRQDWDELLKSIEFGSRSLLLSTKSSCYYQLIRIGQDFSFRYLGNELSGIDHDHLIMDFSDVSRLLSGKKDYSIASADMIRIEYRITHQDNAIYNSNARLTFHLCDGKKKHYNFIEDPGEFTIMSYFNELNLLIDKPTRKDSHQPDNHDSMANTGRQIKWLKPAGLALNIISIAITVLFLFVDVNYKAFSISCIAVPLVVYSLYFIFYDGIVLYQEKCPYFGKSKINLTAALIAPVIALLLRNISDFDLLSYRQFLIQWVILLCLVAAMALLFIKIKKFKMRVALYLIIFMLFYIPAAIIQVNAIFDSSESRHYMASILSKHVETGSKAPDRYFLEIKRQNGQGTELKVSKAYYEAVDLGDQVNIIEKDGLLHIPYAFVDEN